MSNLAWMTFLERLWMRRECEVGSQGLAKAKPTQPWTTIPRGELCGIHAVIPQLARLNSKLQTLTPYMRMHNRLTHP